MSRYSKFRHPYRYRYTFKQYLQAHAGLDRAIKLHDELYRSYRILLDSCRQHPGTPIIRNVLPNYWKEIMQQREQIRHYKWLLWLYYHDNWRTRYDLFKVESASMHYGIWYLGKGKKNKHVAYRQRLLENLY